MVVLVLMLLLTGVFFLDLTHAMAIFLRVVISFARHVINAKVLVNMLLMEMAKVETGMVVKKVVMVMVGMFKFMSLPFNTSRVILEAEGLDLVDLSTSFSTCPWSLYFSLPKQYL